MELKGCMINKQTVRTAQHDDRVIWHVPMEAEIGIPHFHEEWFTLHITRQYTLSAYLSNNLYIMSVQGTEVLSPELCDNVTSNCYLIPAPTVCRMADRTRKARGRIAVSYV